MKKVINCIWQFFRPYLTASKVIIYAVIATNIYISNRVLEICYMAIDKDYSGSMPYLTALIGLIQVVTGTIISFYLNKSKAENTAGGITYDMAMSQTNRHIDGE